jgi:hypothetical protein
MRGLARGGTVRIGQLVAGIAAAHPDDEARFQRGAALFDDSYASQGDER